MQWDPRGRPRTCPMAQVAAQACRVFCSRHSSPRRCQLPHSLRSPRCSAVQLAQRTARCSTRPVPAALRCAAPRCAALRRAAPRCAALRCWVVRRAALLGGAPRRITTDRTSPVTLVAAIRTALHAQAHRCRNSYLPACAGTPLPPAAAPATPRQLRRGAAAAKALAQEMKEKERQVAGTAARGVPACDCRLNSPRLRVFVCLFVGVRC